MSENNMHSLEKLISKQWEDLRDKLLNEEVTLDNIREYDFFKHFDDTIQNVKTYRTVVLSKEMIFPRAVKGSGHEISRFIPSLEYAKNHNRMNPPQTVFLYLGYDDGKKRYSKKNAVKTCLKELRVNIENTASICDFAPSNQGIGKKVIDITQNENKDYSLQNLELTFEKQIWEARMSRASGNFKNVPNDREIIERISATFYFNLFNNDEIFKPIDQNQEDIESIRKREYAPFQFLAKYFEREGFAGIIYQSTVNKSGKNLVLFNTSDANCISDIPKEIEASDYYL